MAMQTNLEALIEAAQHLSAEERERLVEALRRHSESPVHRQQLESLKLSRSRVEQQLSKAVQPAHREMLMKALQSIEKEIEYASQTPRHITEMRGLGKDLWQGIDPQDYLNAERDSWDN